MTIKELIKAELDYLSEEDLQKFYQLLKSHSQRQKENQDELGTFAERRCFIRRGSENVIL